MPLHYAIRALLGLGVAAGHPGLQTLLNEVEQYLEGTGRDKGGQIQRNLKKFSGSQCRPDAGSAAPHDNVSLHSLRQVCRDRFARSSSDSI